MKYFDCHADTLTEIRNAGESLGKNTCGLDLERTKKFAQTYAQIFAIWKDRKLSDQTCLEEEFHRVYLRAAALLEAEKESIVWCRTGKEMEQAHKNGKAAAFLSIEDVSVMGRETEKIRELGFRFAMLSWNYENEYACGAAAGQRKGLTKKGKRLAKELLGQGVVLDISHLSDKGAEELFEMTDAPLIASHSNVREVWDCPRNLSRKMVQELIRRRGLVGMNFYRDFVGSAPAIQDLIRHMDAVLELGGEDVLALGGDLDGCGGSFPDGICGVESVPDLCRCMVEAGFGKELVNKICFENARQFVLENVK